MNQAPPLPLPAPLRRPRQLGALGGIWRKKYVNPAAGEPKEGTHSRAGPAEPSSSAPSLQNLTGAPLSRRRIPFRRPVGGPQVPAGPRAPRDWRARAAGSATLPARRPRQRASHRRQTLLGGARKSSNLVRPAGHLCAAEAQPSASRLARPEWARRACLAAAEGSRKRVSAPTSSPSPPRDQTARTPSS